MTARARAAQGGTPEQPNGGGGRGKRMGGKRMWSTMHRLRELILFHDKITPVILHGGLIDAPRQANEERFASSKLLAE